MSFKGLNSGLLNEINSWDLPQPIINAFLFALHQELDRKTPDDIPQTHIGYNTNILVRDPDDPSKTYVFFVLFNADGDDFWIAQCQCQGVNDKNKFFWGPKSTSNFEPNTGKRPKGDTR